LDISIHFDARQCKTVMQFSYVSDNGIQVREVDMDRNNPYPGVRINAEQVKLLIQFMNESLVPSQMKEPDYNAQRGISVPVDTDRSKD
jgi:hypothetical protein